MTTNPPLLSLTIDLTTGAIAAVGKDGRMYAPAEVQAALDGAKRGDAGALATVAILDHTPLTGMPTGPDAAAAILQHQMDNCPLCQEEQRVRAARPSRERRRR